MTKLQATLLSTLALYAGCTGDRTGPRAVVEWTLGEVTLALARAADAPWADVVGALRLSDGRIVVADAGSSSVHLFSPAGDPIRSFGRPGDGPGEFRSIASLGVRPGDTLWVHDFAHQRVTFLTGELEPIRTVSLEPRLGSGLVVGVRSDGSILAGEAWSSTRVAQAREPGLNREPVAYVAYAPDGALVDTIALVPGREVVLTLEDGRGVMGPAPLGRTAVHALVGDRLVTGDQVEPVLEIHGPGRVGPDTISWPGSDRGVSPELVAAWRAARLRSVRPPERARLERQLERVELPPRAPAYGPLLPGTGGDIWVGAYTPAGEDPETWLVVDAHGERVARIRMADRFRPLHVAGDELVGVRRDDLDVQTVEVRRLVPGPSG